MNLSILKIKKSQINASKSEGVETIEAPKKVQVKDFSGVPEADVEAKVSAKAPKKTTTTKARATRKVSAVKDITDKRVVIASVQKSEKTKPKSTVEKFTVVDYSEKSVALFGDTKPIKEQLKKMGGRFNANLRPFADDTRVPGWIFPIKVKADLQKLIK